VSGDGPLEKYKPVNDVPAGSRRGVKRDALRDPRRGKAIERDAQRALESHWSPLERQRA
jgi:hypothetical protein